MSPPNSAEGAVGGSSPVVSRGAPEQEGRETSISSQKNAYTDSPGDLQAERVLEAENLSGIASAARAFTLAPSASTVDALDMGSMRAASSLLCQQIDESSGFGVCPCPFGVHLKLSTSRPAGMTAEEAALGMTGEEIRELAADVQTLQKGVAKAKDAVVGAEKALAEAEEKNEELKRRTRPRELWCIS
ncbi:unnamed protein product [Zymoseptoria tritici ST99CH_1A5]|uniref:Uncharacterized protein n=2 Tax=Zymoseptoria tritici TaxID=1047171 RepID=F9XAM4_ZYMTI|nr:uncharacterized protein MYCGRDRAFT_92977 [Zymoseptoria tritici IPO323]EGP87746.1 hypothetical protein MYCGRDRAFT_92977 [Zymoseptoria tritici IPO323]SMR53336.1 unnamed protein product [Zymoseptoria tritici ST99CH_3D1]SMY24159.1 unnamed protein product [Zymoseptoria tritici ST99CH_1A5]